jgi:hypothetical protein
VETMMQRHDEIMEQMCAGHTSVSARTLLSVAGYVSMKKEDLLDRILRELMKEASDLGD